MEFVCVLSVKGSLASYMVTRENDTTYKAIQKTGNSKREDLPFEIVLEKMGPNAWQAEPWLDELIAGLTRCIETPECKPA